VDLLRRLSPRSFDVREALAAAEGEGILVIAGHRVQFAHPILASVVYGEIGERRRREIHRRVALMADDLEARARHLALAAAGPDAAVAALVESAAELAWRRGAPDASAHLLRTSCRLTPPDDGDALALRRVALGRILYHAGDAQGAEAELWSVVDAIPPGPVRARALYHLMYVARASGGMVRSVEYGLRAAEEAAADPAFQAEAYEWLSRMADNDTALKLDTARRGLDAIGRVRDPDPEAVFYAKAALVEAEFHAGLGIHLDMLEDPPAASRLRFPPIRTASRADDLIGRLLGFAGRFDEARETLRGLHDRAAVQNRSILPAVLGWMSAVEVMAGRFRAAVAITDEAIERIDETGSSGILRWVLGLRAVALVALGRLDDGEAAVQEALAVPAEPDRTHPDPDRYLALLGRAMAAMARGRSDSAAEDLREMERALQAAGVREPRLTMHAPELIEALIGVGASDEAEACLARFEEDAARSAGEWSLCASARCRALLLAADGRLDEAIDAAERSLVELRGLAFEFERARSLLVKGQILRRRRQKRSADETLREALASFERMETPSWAERARAELARVGLRPHAPEDLTETERRVARLAAEGMTNREVATAAFLAPKSVEQILSRVYRKLGIASRAELGAWASRQSDGARMPDPSTGR
jgi:DNA-binding CsgD family transcriptional regulator